MRSAALETSLPVETDPPGTPDFNLLAHIYRWMEWLTFGPFLQRSRCAFLSRLQQQRRALVIGDGDGRFTACLLRANTRISVDAIDSSDAMLRQLTLRVASNRVHTRTADARIFQPTRHDYDLIATHFFLDCLTSPQVSRLAVRMRNDSSPNALWVISEFAIPPNIYGRTIARPLISALYLAFGLLTGLKIRQLPNHRSALTQAGWYLVAQQNHLGGLLISEMWQLSRRP